MKTIFSKESTTLLSIICPKRPLLSISQGRTHSRSQYYKFEVRPKREVEIRPEVEFEAFPVSPYYLHTTTNVTIVLD